MTKLRRFAVLALLALVAASPTFAQGTTGAIEGKVTDDQGLALPGANVTATRPSTGFTRSTVTDANGVFRLPGLLVGAYTVKVELTGFAPSLHSVIVNVAATTTPDVRMKVAGQTEQVTVMAETPIIDTTDSGVGEVITSEQIANLPLNGRQFGNLAALAPGVSLGFHTDPTKSTQFAPQVGGGGGRNINYLIDGGDNNDDTVGGMVQNFPLDSIGEFNFETSRFRADTGRANGGTIKVVTKSGTNQLQGSGFGYFRNDALNSQTETEKNAGVDKGEYERYQYGASLGGPIIKDRTHFFASFERISQDTTQAVNTKGLYPEKDGVYAIPYRENMMVAKLTHQINPGNYLSVRYGYNDNSQPYGAGASSPPESWGDSTNTFHSANLNLSSVLGGGKLNEFTFQYSYFLNNIAPVATLPSESYPNGVFVGTSVNVPQTTEQHKYQFRDDFTWTAGKHQLRVGASFIYEPTLDITFSTGQQPLYVHQADSRTAPISSIGFNGSIGGEGGLSGATIPNNQYSLYVQDAWRVTDRLMLDIGVRYDLVTGFAFDQDANILYSELRAAAKAGVFNASGLPCPCTGFEDFGKDPSEDKNNIAPRVGFTYDVKGDGDFVLRGGAGRYYDFAYTNANILFAVIGAQSSFGSIYSNTNSSGIRNADGSFYQVGQPLPPNQLTNVSTPLPSHAATPRAAAALHRPGQPGLLQAARQRLRGRDRRRLRQGARARHAAAAQRSHQRRRAALLRDPAAHGQLQLPRRPDGRRKRLQGRQLRREEALGRQAPDAGELHALGFQIERQPASHRRVRRLQRAERIRPLGRSAAQPDLHRRTPPLPVQRHLEPGLGPQHLAGLPLPHEDAVQHHHRLRRQPGRGDERHPGDCRDAELGARVGLQPARPAAGQEVLDRQPGSRGADRRDVQRVQRHEPRRLRREHALGHLRPADDVLGRLPARRAADRPVRPAPGVLADSLP